MCGAEFTGGAGAMYCPACKKIYKRQKQAEYRARDRIKKEDVPIQKTIPFLDQNGALRSGVPGVTWRPKEKQWMVMYCKKYLGQFTNLEDAVATRKAAEATKKPRFCKTCGKQIPSDWDYRIRYCSEACREKQMNDYHREYYKKLRKAVPRICIICGKPIPEEINGHVKVCSDACRDIMTKRAAEKRRAETLSAERKSRPKEIQDRKGISFCLPAGMLDKLKNNAEQEQKTVSQYLRDLIQCEIDKKEGTE